MTECERTSPRAKRRAVRSVGRSRRRRVVTGAVGLAVAAVGLAGCWSGDQDAVLATVNKDRAGKAVALTGRDQIMVKAQKWADHMARTGVLEHTGGGTKIDPSGITGQCGLGEIVGTGGTLAIVNTAWMNSRVHRGNILNTTFSVAGTGLARSGGKVWAIVIFIKPC